MSGGATAEPTATAPVSVGAATTTPATDTTASAAPDVPNEVVLDVRNLRTFFFTYEGVVKALDGVSFQLRRGETTGMVGETGCGKSVTAMSVARLIADPPGRIYRGQVRLHRADLLKGLEAEATFKPVPGTPRVKVRRRFRRIRRANERMEAVRGRHIAMIFQEPSQALNPVFSIANQFGELIYLHHGREVIEELLKATPNAPAVRTAVAELLRLPAEGDPNVVRAAADALAAAAHHRGLATEAFYIVRSHDSVAGKRERIERALDRLRLSGFQRSYLRYRHEELRWQEARNAAYLAYMAGDPPRPGLELALKTRRTGARLSHFYFGLYGVHRYVERPVNDALFWRVVHQLENVRIANPVQIARGYPHELSGGMIQRVMIAMALSGDPEVLLADEPTTALDVTIQAQILELLGELRRRVGTAILLITHDLAVVAEVADRVCVMYAGQIVEQGPVTEVFRHPLHPYTDGLLNSVPRIDRPDKKLQSIPGAVPDLIEPPSGCRFHPRCPKAMPICKEKRPAFTQQGPEHLVACYLYPGTGVTPGGA